MPRNGLINAPASFIRPKNCCVSQLFPGTALAGPLTGQVFMQGINCLFNHIQLANHKFRCIAVLRFRRVVSQRDGFAGAGQVVEFTPLIYLRDVLFRDLVDQPHGSCPARISESINALMRKSSATRSGSRLGQGRSCLAVEDPMAGV